MDCAECNDNLILMYFELAHDYLIGRLTTTRVDVVRS